MSEDPATDGRPSERDACPPADALRGLVRRQGSEASRLQTLMHAMTCSSCRPELALLRAAERGAEQGSGESRWSS